ncbi:hypothetical protein TeGR_g6791 [Tetraparma gracilis]|uniref:Uncharacterized protein n=2 Tax=Tetraparma gracilis TaxID=2962635 RepID=A0ABQ6N1H1_9STRA|nr:hypothetical protein TeGR_g6791 [Tetraparma gracilis]
MVSTPDECIALALEHGCGIANIYGQFDHESECWCQWWSGDDDDMRVDEDTSFMSCLLDEHGKPLAPTKLEQEAWFCEFVAEACTEGLPACTFEDDECPEGTATDCEDAYEANKPLWKVTLFDEACSNDVETCSNFFMGMAKKCTAEEVIEIKVEATMAVEGLTEESIPEADSPAMELLVDTLAATIAKTITAAPGTEVEICQIGSAVVGCTDKRRRRLDDGAADIIFEITVPVFCEDADCSNAPSEEEAGELMAAVEADMAVATADSEAFTEMMEETFQEVATKKAEENPDVFTDEVLAAAEEVAMEVSAGMQEIETADIEISEPVTNVTPEEAIQIEEEEGGNGTGDDEEDYEGDEYESIDGLGGSASTKAGVTVALAVAVIAALVQ